MKHLYDSLRGCAKEEEVKAEFCKFFKMKIFALRGIDHYTEQVLFEFKYDRNFRNPENVARALAQVMYYARLLKFGAGLTKYPLPPYICVVDKNEAFFAETKDYAKFYADNGDRYDWGRAPSTPCPKLVEDIFGFLTQRHRISGGTDPTNRHSFVQTQYVSVTNTASLVHAVYLAWGYSATGWESNGLASFPQGFGTNAYETASPQGAVYIKAFCDLNDNGEYDADDDILAVRQIPFGREAHFRIAFGDVDGDGVPDAQERHDGTDPDDANSFRLRAKFRFTDHDAGHGCTNLVAVSLTETEWDPVEVVKSSTDKTFVYTVNTNVTHVPSTNIFCYLVSGKYLPTLCFNQEKGATVLELAALDSEAIRIGGDHFYHYGHTSYTNLVSVQRCNVRGATVDGNSGCPVFLVVGDELVLLFSNHLGSVGVETWSHHWGPMLPFHFDAVQHQINQWEGANASQYQLEQCNFSSFSEVVNQ